MFAHFEQMHSRSFLRVKQLLQQSFGVGHWPCMPALNFMSLLAKPSILNPGAAIALVAAELVERGSLIGLFVCVSVVVSGMSLGR